MVIVFYFVIALFFAFIEYAYILSIVICNLSDTLVVF